MKLLRALIVLLTVTASAGAFAQCSATGTLTASAIRGALGGIWACSKDGTDVWNEQIPNATSGTVRECHSGLTSGPDPINNNQGTFSINNNGGQTPDTITYNYPPSGGSYTYQVYNVSAGGYTFCRVSDAKTYTVRATTCPPPTLNACP